MKIALVVGRGFEGAGVTKYIIEMCNYFKKNDIEHEVYEVDDKKWGRAKLQDVPEHKLIDEKSIKTIHKELNKFDYVFLSSVPSKKHSQWAIDGFFEMVKNITSKKVIFQNDHKIASIHRNANYIEICNYVDGIVSHSITSPFYNRLIKTYGSSIKSKFVQLHVGFDFDQHLSYRKEDHLKKITYLGRFATFKQPDRLFGFLPYAVNNNLLLEMKGVERSLGALHIFYDDLASRTPKSDIIEVTKKAIANGLEYDDLKRDLSKIYVFGPYEYTDGMESMSRSLVGADFYHLDAMAYGDNFEYAQCEIIGVGSIPMFCHHWAENCYIHENGKKTNKKYVDLENYGLFVKKDLSNVEEIVEKINEIDASKALKKKYLECSFEVTRNHCSSDFIFENMINDIEQLDMATVIIPKSLF